MTTRLDRLRHAMALATDDHPTIIDTDDIRAALAVCEAAVRWDRSGCALGRLSATAEPSDEYRARMDWIRANRDLREAIAALLAEADTQPGERTAQ